MQAASTFPPQRHAPRRCASRCEDSSSHVRLFIFLFPCRFQQFRADMDAAAAVATREKSELEHSLAQQMEAAVKAVRRDSASVVASLKVRETLTLVDAPQEALRDCSPEWRPLCPHLQADLESSASEVVNLLERCRALQKQTSVLAGEVRDARDQSRSWQDEALRAKAALAADSEASAVLNRTLVAQVGCCPRFVLH